MAELGKKNLELEKKSEKTEHVRRPGGSQGSQGSILAALGARVQVAQKAVGEAESTEASARAEGEFHRAHHAYIRFSNANRDTVRSRVALCVSIYIRPK